MKIIIVSRIDGRHRGGIRHPIGATAYGLDELTIGQLRDVVSDETFVAVVGHEITADMVADFLLLGDGDALARPIDSFTLDDVPLMPPGFVRAGGSGGSGSFFFQRDPMVREPGSDEPPLAERPSMLKSELETPLDAAPLAERPSMLDPANASAGAEAGQIDEQGGVPTVTDAGGAAREISTEMPNEDLVPKKRGRKTAEG